MCCFGSFKEAPFLPSVCWVWEQCDWHNKLDIHLRLDHLGENKQRPYQADSLSCQLQVSNCTFGNLESVQTWSHYRAPTDCVQYFTGISNQIYSYNFGQMLGSMDYNNCIRMEVPDVVQFLVFPPRKATVGWPTEKWVGQLPTLSAFFRIHPLERLSPVQLPSSTSRNWGTLLLIYQCDSLLIYLTIQWGRNNWPGRPIRSFLWLLVCYCEFHSLQFQLTNRPYLCVVRRCFWNHCSSGHRLWPSLPNQWENLPWNEVLKLCFSTNSTFHCWRLLCCCSYHCSGNVKSDKPDFKVKSKCDILDRYPDRVCFGLQSGIVASEFNM